MYNTLQSIVYLATDRNMAFVPAAGHDWHGDWDKGKQPLVSIHEASADPTQLRAWSAKYNGCNWLYVPGPGQAVLDVDPRHGGGTLLQSLAATHGKLPLTARSKSGRGDGGGHYLFACDEALSLKRDIGGNPGLTLVCGRMGGFVCPPSVHAATDKPYVWEVAPWDVEPARLPDWLLTLAGATPRREPMPKADADDGLVLTLGGAWTLEAHPGAVARDRGGEGRRPTLVRLVGVALDAGLDPDEVERQALAWNDRCTPPLSEAEVRKHVRGLGGRHEAARPEAGQPPTPLTPQEPPGGQSANKQASRVGAVGPSGNTLPACLHGAEPEQASGPHEAPGTNTEQPACLFAPSQPDRVRVDITEDRSDSLVPAGLPACLQPFQRPPEGGSGAGGVGCTALAPAALNGLAGGIVKAVGPRTEADEPAVLLSFLTAFGSAVGFGPCFDHGKPHGTNLFVLLVGNTAVRKGTAWSVGSWLVRQADPEWANDKVVGEGFGSGEGVAWAVRDAKDDGTGKPDPGVGDKRLVVVEQEFSKCLRICKGKESLLSATIRQAFDREPLGKRNKGENSYRATNPHVSIVAHITPDELRAELEGTSHLANGFVNRFLLVNALRTKFISRPKRLGLGKWQEALEQFVGPVADAVGFGKGVGELELDEEAGPVWDGLYEELETRPADTFGKATSRASDYVMKLALLYALLDKANVIRLEHLNAGLAVWKFCEASARFIFGKPEATAGAAKLSLSERLLDRIEGEPGVMRSALTVAFRSYGNAEAIGGALGWLLQQGMAHPADRPTKGATAECWYPGPDNQTPPPTITTGDAEADGFELVLGGEREAPCKEANKQVGLAGADAGPEAGGVGKEASKQASRLVTEPSEPACLFADADRAVSEAEFLTGLASDGQEASGSGEVEGGGGVVHHGHEPQRHPLTAWAEAWNRHVATRPTPLLPNPTDPPGTRYDVDDRGRLVRHTTKDISYDPAVLNVPTVMDSPFCRRTDGGGVRLVNAPPELAEWCVEHRPELLAAVKLEAAAEDARTGHFLAKLDAADG